MKNYVQIATDYANDVTTGNIIACKWVRLACQRFLNDLQRDDITLYPDPDKPSPGDKWCHFLEKLPHVKGKWARERKLFELSQWQVFIIVNIYGWMMVETGLRRFNESYICVPRKSGKTFMIAGVGLGHMCIDDEFAAEVYCGATSMDQALIVFNMARRMCIQKPALTKRFRIEVNKRSLNIHDDASKFQPVKGKPGDGDSPSCAIIDEFHEHQTPDQYDTFRTGMAAREQPMSVIITTAGFNMSSPCYDKQLEVQNMLDGVFVDDHLFGIIYTIDEEDDWDSFESVIKANPNMGVSVSRGYLEGELSAARRSATKQVAFKTKNLNVWVGAKAAWLNILAFQACRKKSHDLKKYHGRDAIIGLDLATRTDIACVGVLILPSATDPKYHYFCYHYLPETTVDEGNIKYKAWHEQGWLLTTPGNATDYDYIEDDIKDLCKQLNVREVAYDPFQATQLSTHLVGEGLPMVELGQTVKNFSEPMKETEVMILEKQITFSEDPVLMWMAGNVVATLDRKDNIFPNKERPENKIDGIVALIMCINRVIWYRSTKRESIYNKLAREKAQNERSE